jgi:glycerophosphoryl diester phosphodiesterase
MGPARLAELAVRSVVAHKKRWACTDTAVQSPHRLVTKRMVDTAHNAGLLVSPWTVNRADDMRTLLSLGVDGIITDYPSTLIDLLKP